MEPMTQPVILLTRDHRGLATVTLNRPEVGNAYNAAMLEALIQGLTSLAADPRILDYCLALDMFGALLSAPLYG